MAPGRLRNKQYCVTINWADELYYLSLYAYAPDQGAVLLEYFMFRARPRSGTLLIIIFRARPNAVLFLVFVLVRTRTRAVLFDLCYG